MSNEQYWENDNENLENELTRSQNSYGDDGIANLRKAKRADEKRIKELEEQCHKKEKELAFILSKSPEDLWRIDLNDLLKKLI